jgi:hypothetical protein
MPILVEKNVFQKLFNTFLGAKSQNKEKQFISKIKHSNPDVAAAFSQFDDVLVKNSLSLRNTLKKYGLDTSGMDNVLNKYYDIK